MGLPVIDTRNDVASLRVVYLSTVSQGSGELYRFEKADFKDESEVSMVNEIGNPNAAGFIRKPGGVGISFECYEQVGLSWPDWDALKATGEDVTITDQIVGGRGWSYGPAKVSKVDRSGDKDASNTVSIDLGALQRKPLQ